MWMGCWGVIQYRCLMRYVLLGACCLALLFQQNQWKRSIFVCESITQNKVSASNSPCSFLLYDWVQVEGAAVQSGRAVWNCHDVMMHLSPSQRFVWCAAVFQGGVNRERRQWRKEGILRKYRGFTNDVVSVYNFTPDVCVSVLVPLFFVWCIHTHTHRADDTS